MFTKFSDEWLRKNHPLSFYFSVIKEHSDTCKINIHVYCLRQPIYKYHLVSSRLKVVQASGLIEKKRDAIMRYCHLNKSTMQYLCIRNTCVFMWTIGSSTITAFWVPSMHFKYAWSNKAECHHSLFSFVRNCQKIWRVLYLKCEFIIIPFIY
jgi:hypothetical protein